MTKQERLKAARKRANSMHFGQHVTNISAGEGNPLRYAFFVQAKDDGNRVRITDGNKRFADVMSEVIYPGRLDADKCKALFEPVWQAHYGKEPPQ